MTQKLRTNENTAKAKTRPAKKPKAVDSAHELAVEVHKFLDERKAREILLLNLEPVNSYFRYFLIANAVSGVHLKSLVRDIRKMFGSRMPEKGAQNDDAASGWVVIDFIDVVVHLFIPEQRAFYRLERLWGDAEIVKVRAAGG